MWEFDDLYLANSFCGDDLYRLYTDVSTEHALIIYRCSSTSQAIKSIGGDS